MFNASCAVMQNNMTIKGMKNLTFDMKNLTKNIIFLKNKKMTLLI